ncbi:MAG: DUF2891 family protein [Myxococcota bacterium]
MTAIPMPLDLARRIAVTALDGITRAWPYQPGHVWTGPDDGAPPKVWHPIFHGCYDWHSAVHAHWTLARLTNRGLLDARTAHDARMHLVTSLTPERVAVEQAYFEHPARKGFEWPYGWAWLFMLAAELSQSSDPGLTGAGEALRPLIDLLADRIGPRLAGQLGPIRTGTHRNSGFALELFWDAAPDCGRPDLRPLITEHAIRFFGEDVNYPWAYEPSAYDFLSAGLTAIGVMRRVLEPEAFDGWLERYGPPAAHTLMPIRELDPTDGWLAHLVGLDLSRAWELRALAAHRSAHPQASEWQTSAAAHREAAMSALFSGHYAGDHWLGTFALYGA